MWAWIEHRVREGRRDTFGDLPFGGIPLVFSYGDTHQLPPVAGTGISDPNPGQATRSDGIGARIFGDFLNPPASSNVTPVTVVMDLVMRQDDEVLKGVLEAMKQGLVNQEQAKWLLAHQMSNQSQETLDQFDEEALVIMPTWARTTPYTLQ